MNKKSIYIVVVILFLATSGFIVLKYQSDKNKSDARIYELLPRNNSSAQYADWVTVKKEAANLLLKIKANENDLTSKIKLSALYLQEARISGNYMYYDMAAMKLVNDVLRKDANNFEGLAFKATIFLSQHHFAEGLAVAEQVRQLYPYNAFVYGILTDANVELGRYDSALICADKMVSIRPDLRSYSRISYQREIHGDNNGAIEAMKLAVEAGAPGDENTEWSRIQLAKLYEHNGKADYAKMNYTIALSNRPGYPHALAGLARISVAEKNYPQAIELYKKADSSITDFTIKEELAQAYLISGNKKDADHLSDRIVEEMIKASQKNKYSDTSGHYSDREIAYAYIATGNYSKALEHEMIEYNRRPANIDINEAVAWVYYNKGNTERAVQYIKEALKTNCKNPVLLCRAGLIYASAGDKVMAKTILQDALKNDPLISPILKAVAEKTLQSL
jgi:tetratricopeptide (TPR) repeat protein